MEFLCEFMAKANMKIVWYEKGEYLKIVAGRLKGKNGVMYKMVNVRGVEKGAFKNGRRDSVSVPGVNLTATIDLELQQYGEWLMEGLPGAVVALEPKSGEILSIISSPSYSPGYLSGRLFSQNFCLQASMRVLVLRCACCMG